MNALLGLSFALGLMAAGPTGGDEAQVQPASRCPRLFGDPAARERNRAQRRSHLEQVVAGEHLINLTHTGAWRAPEAIRFKGLRLVAVVGSEQAEPRALLEVDQLDQGLGCEAGLYAIGVDDSIGGQTRVLAILPAAVLLEHEGQLRYLKPLLTEAPIFRMIWRSTWKIAGAAPTGGGATTAAPGRVSPAPAPPRPQASHTATTHRAPPPPRPR